MERIFIKNVGKNFSKGEVRDYSKGVWDHIARNAGKPLEEFTKPAKQVPVDDQK